VNLKIKLTVTSIYFTKRTNDNNKAYKIIIIIAPLTIVSDDQWGDLECLYIKPAKHAARTDGGLFTNTGVDEREMF